MGFSNARCHSTALTVFREFELAEKMESPRNRAGFGSPESAVFTESGRLCSVPTREVTGNAYILEFYPEINISREMFHGTSLKAMDDRRSLMIPVSEPLIKRITRTFFEDGLTEALEEAASPQSATISPVISSFAKYALHLLQIIKKLKATVHPHLNEEGMDSIAKYSETRDWSKSHIRCIRWHPNCFKIAVASSDDSIRVYTDEPAVVPILKSGTQKCITSLAWRPYSAAELAVGCQIGVLLWTMDPNLHVTRPLSQANLLKHPNMNPVTSVEWSPDGCLLATTSINNTDVLIWDVDQCRNVPLKRVGFPCSFLKWSPDGTRMFSSTIGNVFRVWTTDKWIPDRWTIATGSIQSAAWSPCGSFLLFVTTGEPILYRLQFIEEQIFTSSNYSKQALAIADLSKVEVGARTVGGMPQAIAWDPNGQYLAIIFKDSCSVVVFATSIYKHQFNISPSCFITGLGAEFPSYICFQSKNRKNSDSVLTIGWSSGRIQYFPFVNM